MREHITQFIKQCPICQKLSSNKTAIVTKPFTMASYEPFKVISIDTVDRFPKVRNDNQYLIVIIDNCT